MLKSLKRFLSCFLIAAMLVGMTSAVSAQAALKKPGNCRFVNWTNDSFTSCKIKWNKVDGATEYYLRVTYTDGSHAKEYKTTSTSYTLKKLADNHVYRVKVRAACVDPATNTLTYSPYSNITFITPSPKELSVTLTNKKKIQVDLSWNPVYGCNGYNVFLTTNPEGDWYWNQSTATKATATSASVKKFRGDVLQKYQNYYVRLISRRKRNGVFCTVPLPSESYYNMGFQMIHIR